MKNFKKKKTTMIMMFLLVVTLLATGCGRKGNEDTNNNSNREKPIVQIEMQDGSKMVLELYPEFAPETVQNFVDLASEGFFDGLTFHRIVEGFMIQGGDPDGNGTGGSSKNIKGEFAENGFTQNTLQHTKGVISMARSASPDSASSQFFIVHDDATFLDGKYAAFGKLIEGEETLDAIAATPVEINPLSGEVSTPTEDVVIKSITVQK